MAPLLSENYWNMPVTFQPTVANNRSIGEIIWLHVSGSELNPDFTDMWQTVYFLVMFGSNF